jgi:hypothetical protein
MKTFPLIAIGLILSLPVHGQERSAVMNDVTIWYEAFNKRNAALAEPIMSENWVDIPAGPGRRPVHPRRSDPHLSRLQDYPCGNPSGRKQGRRAFGAHRHASSAVHGLSSKEPESDHPDH